MNKIEYLVIVGCTILGVLIAIAFELDQIALELHAIAVRLS